MNINIVCLSGRVTADSVLRSTPSGKTVLNFGLASNGLRMNPENDNWEDVPAYADCVMFGEKAQRWQPHLTKGVKVVVHGEWVSRRWQDKADPRKVNRKVELKVNRIDTMDYHGNANARGGQPAPVPAAPTPEQAADQFADDDIPF